MKNINKTIRWKEGMEGMKEKWKEGRRKNKMGK